MIEISMKQIPAYVVVKKRYVPDVEDEHPSEFDLPEFHFIPDDKQIPVIRDDNRYLYDDGSPWCSTDAPELVGGSIFATKEGADKFKDNLAWNYKFEVREMLVNERIKLPEDSQYKKLATAPMICFQMIEGEPYPMCINNYVYILNKIGLPYWADAERFTNGKIIIMPVDTFMKEYKIVPRTEEPA
ncbi:hypothetical protein [Bacteroides acidifaciens]|uniref:hypothetical protein n=1 Tax=Bacteroides acidifaciens TaxID=85831 RepID=UPI0026EE30D3|nr:hypothetical protein [Bacteroides acidifaciens]